MIFDGDRDYIAPYLRYLADQIGLRDWTVNVLDKVPDDENHAAENDVRYGRKWANICFATDWTSEPEESFRATCVHELLHCTVNPVLQPLLDAEDMLGKMAFTPIYNASIYALEHAVDAIAEEWSRYLPLPSEWLEQATGPEGD